MKPDFPTTPIGKLRALEKELAAKLKNDEITPAEMEALSEVRDILWRAKRLS